MNDALVVCREHFEEFWGQRLLNAMRALHDVKYNSRSEAEEEDGASSPVFDADADYTEDDLYEGLETGEDEDYDDYTTK